MTRLARILFGLGLGLLAQAGPAFAQSGALPDAQPKVTASFIPERAAVAPGGTITVALRELIREKWHTYFINPGDSGAPTIINWQLPEGWTAAAPQFPYPERIPVGPLMNFGYENEVVLLNEITAPASAQPGQSVMLEADVMWLVCSDVCIPEETHLSLPLPVAGEAPPPSAENAELFAAARAKLPHPSPWMARYEATDGRFALLVDAPELAFARPKSAVFYPYTDGLIEARRDDELFGAQRVAASIARHAAEASSEELVQRVYEDARSFGEVTDDTVVLILRRLSTPRP